MSFGAKVTAKAETQTFQQEFSWEDSDPAAGRWWMSRARDVDGGRDFFIARDDMTDALIGLLRVPPQSHYTVVAAAFLDRFESTAAAVDALKHSIAIALTHAPEAAAVRRALLYWRSVRTLTVLRRNFPFILLGLCAGGLLGLAVTLFSAWTTFVGWPMVAAGVVFGGAVGTLLKLAVENYRAKAVAGPWGRFALIMLGVMAGAGATAAGALLTFWH